MAKHPFRVAIERGASEAELGRLFAPDVVLMGSVLTTPLMGVSAVLNFIQRATTINKPIRTTYEVSDTRQTFFVWSGQVDGFAMDGATLLADGEDGLIHEVRVLMRPWSVVKRFRDAMSRELSSVVAPSAWELGPKPAPGAPRPLAPIAMKPIELAPDVVLHSPVLSRALSGRDRVEEALRVAHEAESAVSDTAIIAGPDLVIESFESAVDGYSMEGLSIEKLDGAGRISDLTVMLRPYPVVTLFREKSRALAEQRGILGKEYWELPPLPI